ncbi:MAG: hypothetical protein AAGF89_14835 [Bacteroidota bacterium]
MAFFRCHPPNNLTDASNLPTDLNMITPSLRFFLLLYLLCSLPIDSLAINGLKAQSGLDGEWEGTMTVGGIYSNERLPMKLYLTTEGRSVSGRSYVQLPNGGTLRMDLEGYLYKDRSISLIEVKFAGDPQNNYMPEFNRQYQIIYKADLWDPQLKGFWQEVTDITFDEKRQRGRMTLSKRKGNGA